MSIKAILIRRAVAAMIGAASFTWNAPAQGQGSAPSSKPAKGWRLSSSLGLATEYDNNVFLLDRGRKDDLALPAADEVASGRYTGMENASDLITTLSAALGLKGPGMLGKTLTLTPAVAYELYGKNSERSNAVFELSVEQDLPNDGRLRLQGRLTPGYFAKNYLVDAVDGDGSGTIARAERVYAGGEYREKELLFDYRFRLAKSTPKRFVGSSLELGTGYYGRVYEAPFAGRDLNGPTARAKLRVDRGRRVSLALGYDFASLSATPTNQVVLLDEPGFGQDFNGNGLSTDLDVRVVTTVDRSRTEHSLGGGIGVDLGKSSDLEVSLEHRWRRFSSTEPLDVSHNGRRDGRNQVSAELGFRLSRGVKLRLGGRSSSQGTNRPGDPAVTGEINDYTKYQANAGLSFNF